jgi:hypothetical protein
VQAAQDKIKNNYMEKFSFLQNFNMSGSKQNGPYKDTTVHTKEGHIIKSTF